jgi:hypothetical protein
MNRRKYWKELNKINFEITGLKCDFCDYRDDNVKFSEYKDSIGKPCPECGNSLLTEKEYLDCIKIYVRIEQLEKLLGILKWFNPINYYRFVFGDKRKKLNINIDYPNRNV